MFNLEWRVKETLAKRYNDYSYSKTFSYTYKVSFYEKFQKTYFEGNYDLINTPFRTNFGYSDLENLFLGKPFLSPDQGRWKQISNPKYYILISQGKRSD